MGTMLKRFTPIIVVLTLFFPLMVSAFPTSFFWSNVWYEHRDYDPLKYSTPLSYKAMIAEVLLQDTGNYDKHGIRVYLNTLGTVDRVSMPFSATLNIGGVFYNDYFYRYDTTYPTSWENKAYFFTIEGRPLLGNSTQMILTGLRELPLAIPTISGNTISWDPVTPSREDAYVRYRLRIHALNPSGLPFGYPLFETPDMTTTSYTFNLPLPLPLVVGKEYGLRLEVKEYFHYYGTADFLNRSTYFSKFTPVPIPATFLLLGSGLLGLVGLARRFKR